MGTRTKGGQGNRNERGRRDLRVTGEPVDDHADAERGQSPSGHGVEEEAHVVESAGPESTPTLTVEAVYGEQDQGDEREEQVEPQVPPQVRKRIGCAPDTMARAMSPMHVAATSAVRSAPTVVAASIRAERRARAWIAGCRRSSCGRRGRSEGSTIDYLFRSGEDRVAKFLVNRRNRAVPAQDEGAPRPESVAKSWSSPCHGRFRARVDDGHQRVRAPMARCSGLVGGNSPTGRSV